MPCHSKKLPKMPGPAVMHTSSWRPSKNQIGPGQSYTKIRNKEHTASLRRLNKKK